MKKYPITRRGKNQSDNLESQKSFLRVADKLVASVTELMRTVEREEDLRIGFEKLLAPILQSIWY